jgi:hypothetical protein
MTNETNKPTADELIRRAIDWNVGAPHCRDDKCRVKLDDIVTLLEDGAEPISINQSSWGTVLHSVKYQGRTFYTTTPEKVSRLNDYEN